MKRITIIIPVYNSPLIGQTLHALAAQVEIERSQVEVLVVGLDEPGYLNRVDRHVRAFIRFLPGTPPHSPAQNRNLGMASASGELICFTDADCVPAPDWLNHLTASFRDPEVHVVGGGVTFQADSYWAQCDNLSWFGHFLAESRGGTRPHLPTLNLCIRKEVFNVVGGIDERFPAPAGEDTEWTLRMRSAGYQLNFVPEAVVHHAPNRTSLGALWNHGYQFGRYSPKHESRSTRSQGASTRTWPDRLLPKERWLMLVSAPFLALVATLRVLWLVPVTWRRIMAVPGLWISKLAWCVGASDALKARKTITVAGAMNDEGVV